jgi:hypothetical protein
MSTFRFADWPIAFSEDSRMLKRGENKTDEFRIVFSISMDAYTQVRLAHIERLKAAGVSEVIGAEEICK